MISIRARKAPCLKQREARVEIIVIVQVRHHDGDETQLGRPCGGIASRWEERQPATSPAPSWGSGAAAQSGQICRGRLVG
jgi:hypothetical protein